MSPGSPLFDRAIRYWIDAHQYSGAARWRRDSGLTAPERWAKHLPDLPTEEHPEVAARCRRVLDQAYALGRRYTNGEMTQPEVYDAIAAENPDLTPERVRDVADYGWLRATK